MASLRRYNRIRSRATSRFRNRRGAALMAACVLLGGAIFLTVQGVQRDFSARLAHSLISEPGSPLVNDRAIAQANVRASARLPATASAGFDRAALELLATAGVDPAPVGSIQPVSPGFRVVRPDPSSPGFREIPAWRGPDR